MMIINFYLKVSKPSTEKTVALDEDCVEMRMLLHNLLKIKAKTRKQYSNSRGK